MLEAINLKKLFGSNAAVDGLSFHLRKGEILGLIGENGAGKSTTLKILVGLIKPDEGRVLYSGKDLFENLKELRRFIGYLPEYDALYENLNAFDYLVLFSEIYRIERDVAEKRIERLLEALKLPGDKLVGEFSKGMKRKLSIARTLVHDPEYLIYDEPTSGLDPSTSLFVTNYMRELTREGKSIIFSAHNMFYVESVCDTILIIKNGRALYFGEMAELREMMRRYVVVYSENGIEREVVVDDSGELRKVMDEMERDGREVVRIETKIPRLEEIYFSLTGNKSIIN